MERLIKEVQAIGIYGDTIRIVPKKEEPIRLERGRFQLKIEGNIDSVQDVRLGFERGVLISFAKDLINCYVKEDYNKIYCGENPQTW